MASLWALAGGANSSTLLTGTVAIVAALTATIGIISDTSVRVDGYAGTRPAAPAALHLRGELDGLAP